MTSTTRGVILIKNGRVYDHAGNVNLPPIADLLIVNGMIAAIRAGMAGAVARGEAPVELGARAVDQTIDATDKLLLPGFVNAHYHSHDVLLKGCFETIPLELAAQRTSSGVSETKHRRDARAHPARRTGMPAQRHHDRPGISRQSTLSMKSTSMPFSRHMRTSGFAAFSHCSLRTSLVRKRCRSGKRWCPRSTARRCPDSSSRSRARLASLLRNIVVSQKRRHPRIALALGPTSPERCTPEILRTLAGLRQQGCSGLYSYLRVARDDADCAADACLGFRVSGPLSSTRGPSYAAREPCA